MTNAARFQRYRLKTIRNSNIYATTLPALVPFEDDETIASAFTAGSYAARVGTISSAVVTYYLDGEETTADIYPAAAVVVRIDTLVTDSLGNTKTFSVSRAVGYSAPVAGTVPAQSWPEGQAGTLDLNGYIAGYGLNFELISGAWPAGADMGGEGVVNITTDVVETASASITVRATNPEGEYDDLIFDVEVVTGVTVTEDGSAVIVDGLAAPFDVSVNTGPYSGNTYTFTTENETAIASAPVALDGPIIAGTTTFTVTPALVAYLDSKHPVTRSYQWERDGSPIGGETGLTYVRAPADSETDITCDETIVSDGDGAYTATFTSNTIAVGDIVAPTLSSTSPTDNATDVAVDAAITATFSENIALGTGSIVLRVNDGGWSDVETFDVAVDIGGGAGTVSVSTNTLTIEPTAALDNSLEYAIRIAATAIEDAAGNAFAGITDDTTWSFTSVASGGVSVNYLLVGGGAAGGSSGGTGGTGGGGGGGEALTGTFEVAVDSYAVVVGAGGVGVSGAADLTGAVGANSTAFGLTANGGGGGGSAGNAGAAGGNGGGGGSTATTGSDLAGGTGDQFNGGAGHGDTTILARAAGGGGGASAVGSAGSVGAGGAGGEGLTSAISGASVVYGSGGGGGTRATLGNAAGGTNAGTGANNGGTSGTSGTANLGGGGGGATNTDGTAGSGGSGVVIISYTTGALTATGGTITTSGGNTIHSFTANGTFEVTSIP